MRLGVSVPNQHADAEVVVPYAMAVARAAGAGGADLLLVGDKHAASGPLAQGGPLLARLVPEATGVTRFAALFLAPLWDHLHLVEVAGTLAALAATESAPFLPIVALGRADGAHAALERPARSPVADLVRAVAGLRALPRPGILAAGPVEQVWVAAERPPAVDRAARLADGWLANAGHRPAALADQVDVLRARTPAAGFSVAVRRDVICRDDDDDARAEAARLTAAGYRGFGPGALVAGDPHRCAAALRELAGVGFDTVVVRPASPDPTTGAADIARFLAEVPPILATSHPEGAP